MVPWALGSGVNPARARDCHDASGGDEALQPTLAMAMAKEEKKSGGSFEEEEEDEEGVVVGCCFATIHLAVGSSA